MTEPDDAGDETSARPDHRDADATADADLVLRSRSGDSAAFAELWRRHYRSGITVARSITSSIDADDLVQEAYSRIYQSILKGGGPTSSFRAYLFTSIRNTAAAWGRARQETAIDELDAVADPATSERATDEALDRSLTHQAFRSLPTRWQEVLWYSEIEGMKPAEIAPLLGMSASAVSQLAFRAREGLREAWIQAHLRTAPEGSDCAWTIDRLGAYARGNLSTRDQQKVERHLADCARCAIVAAEAKDVSRRLALVLLPLTIGAAGTTGYLASLQGGGMPVAALAAMPATVVHGAPGASAAAPASVVGTAAGSGAAGASAAGAAAAAGAGATAGALGGAGAIIGLVVAGAVVVGAVVAGAIVLPALDPPVTADGGSVSASDPQVGSMDAPAQTQVSVAREPLVPADPAAPPATPPVAPPADIAPPTDSDAVTPPQPPTAPTPVTPEHPAAPADPAPPAPPAAPAPPTAPAPSAPPLQAEPSQPAPPTDPDPAQPGPTDPGPTELSPAVPADPGPTDPGPTDPGPADPGEPRPPADPGATLPDGAPGIAASRAYRAPGTFRLTVEVTLSAAPGATVQALVHGEVEASGVADSSGVVTIAWQPTLGEFATNARVGFRYAAGDQAGPVTETRILRLL